MAVYEKYPMIDNYIYLYHTNTYVVLPTYPEQIMDNSSITYSSTNLLGRSAPIYSYSYSGPRTMQLDFKLHRDMMYQINKYNSTITPTLEDDYVDRLIKEVQAASVPNYDASKKMVDPPLVAVRIGNDVYCKGVISSSVTVTYNLPIIAGNRYASVGVAFGISEVDPFDAEVLAQIGSYRNMSTSLDRSITSTLTSSTTKNQYSTAAKTINLNVVYGQFDSKIVSV